MYNPAAPEASFVEIYNTSTANAFDLSRWRIDGIDCDIPDGTIIDPGAYLVFVKNRDVFAVTYGSSLIVSGTFDGSFDNGGETIKLVLSNLKLRESLRVQANHDPLTGLFNRRYLADSLSRELSLSLRRGATLCVAVLDLDHFKRFNDTFGHDAGDLALREAARVMSMNLRKSDIACRLGGEEFALVLPDSSLADTLQRVEQICAFVKQIEIRHGGHLLGTMTLSAGIAGSPEHATTARELLRAADIALFSAKRAGRGQVVLYEPADTERPNALNQRAVDRRPPPRS